MPALFNICLAQKLDDLADPDYSVKLRDELLAGVGVSDIKKSPLEMNPGGLSFYASTNQQGA